MKAETNGVPVDASLLRGWPLPALDGGGGKEERGRVLVVGGCEQVPGAARLAGEAALRVGAGKLQIATAGAAAVPLAMAVPEAKVLGLPSDPRGHIRRASGALQRDCAHADAVLVGPGMDDSPLTSKLVECLLRNATATLVADAGALCAFPRVRNRRSPPILTPHAGEMAALTGMTATEIGDDAARIATDFAARSGALVVLKGAVTHIATPEGGLWLHRGGSVGLGTSGSGDVLAGLIAGLLARGATAEQAAVWGVYLHGRAGEELEAEYGPVGFLAREISARVPRLLQTL
ncbi:MAG: NAD(P)H-hydrate dehydratase [Pseudoxanthomonas sp.]